MTEIYNNIKLTEYDARRFEMLSNQRGGDAEINRSHLRINIFVREQGETEDRPAGAPKEGSLGYIRKYLEDLRRGLNVDIG